MSQKIRAILTGATGMVGEGVLHECLLSEKVEQVAVITRRSCGIKDPKLVEIIHADFNDLSPVENRLSGYNACFFCLGVSSVGMKETVYYDLTYKLTMHFAETLARRNQDLTFCYISGAGTYSSGEGRLMWARVKGKTEMDLMKLPFKSVYNFRPAMLEPTKGLKNTLGFYKYAGWLLPFIKMLAPGQVCSLKQLGIAMINVVDIGYEKKVIEVPDIIALSKGANR